MRACFARRGGMDFLSPQVGVVCPKTFHSLLQSRPKTLSFVPSLDRTLQMYTFFLRYVFGFVNILWKPPAGGPDSSGRGGRRRTFAGWGGPADPADGIFLFLRDFYAICLAL